MYTPFKICQGKLKLHGKNFWAELDYREIEFCAKNFMMNSIIEKSSCVETATSALPPQPYLLIRTQFSTLFTKNSIFAGVV